MNALTKLAPIFAAVERAAEPSGLSDEQTRDEQDAFEIIDAALMQCIGIVSRAKDRCSTIKNLDRCDDILSELRDLRPSGQAWDDAIYEEREG